MKSQRRVKAPAKFCDGEIGLELTVINRDAPYVTVEFADDGKKKDITFQGDIHHADDSAVKDISRLKLGQRVMAKYEGNVFWEAKIIKTSNGACKSSKEKNTSTCKQQKKVVEPVKEKAKEKKSHQKKLAEPAQQKPQKDHVLNKKKKEIQEDEKKASKARNLAAQELASKLFTTHNTPKHGNNQSVPVIKPACTKVSGVTNKTVGASAAETLPPSAQSVTNNQSFNQLLNTRLPNSQSIVTGQSLVGSQSGPNSHPEDQLLNTSLPTSQPVVTGQSLVGSQSGPNSHPEDQLLNTSLPTSQPVVTDQSLVYNQFGPNSHPEDQRLNTSLPTSQPVVTGQSLVFSQSGPNSHPEDQLLNTSLPTSQPVVTGQSPVYNQFGPNSHPEDQRLNTRLPTSQPVVTGQSLVCNQFGPNSHPKNQFLNTSLPTSQPVVTGQSLVCSQSGPITTFSQSVNQSNSNTCGQSDRVWSLNNSLTYEPMSAIGQSVNNQLMHAPFLHSEQNLTACDSSRFNQPHNTNLISSSVAILNNDDDPLPTDNESRDNTPSVNCDNELIDPGNNSDDTNQSYTSANNCNICSCCSAKDEEIAMLKRKLTCLEEEAGSLEVVARKRSYKPKTRPEMRLADYVIVPEKTAVPAGFQSLAPGASVAVRPTWLAEILSTIGKQRDRKQKRAEKKKKQESKQDQSTEIIKRLMDGFFEPSEIAINGGTKAFEKNEIYRSLKCYAIHTLKMDAPAFNKSWNQKMCSARQTLNRKIEKHTDIDRSNPDN